eukprot:TRINITY_DN10418_c0_g1_i17.p1 TRINITY_DN10418_c0_g1~~TRINITY_DN10418_c0_g1_i17.p1  ORF type:complete len:130 (-),score=35.28 TRINITY_DN10418_c0_g1_i17:36-425(-)
MTLRSGRGEDDSDRWGAIQHEALCQEDIPAAGSFFRNHKIPAAGWKSAMQSLQGGAVEELIFDACDLDEEKMTAIAGELSNMKHSVKKISFSGNRKIPAAGWKSAMQSLQGGAVEELIFDARAIWTRRR